MKIILFYLLFLDAFALNLSIVGEEHLFSGPNCHNTAFRAAGVMDVKRYIREDEMVDIRSHFCELTNDEVGSIGIIEVGKEKRPMHAFINIDEQNVLTKNGITKRAEIEISSFNEMFDMHKKAIEFDCKRKDISRDECEIKIGYYRCQNIESTESEKLISEYYSQRENLFIDANLLKLKQELHSDITKGKYSCSKFKSIIQTLEIANWNNRGPVELEKMRAFVIELENEFEEDLCL